MNVITRVIFPALSLMCYSSFSSAYTCVTAAGAVAGGGNTNVYVGLTPSIAVGQNIVVDLSSQISCRNDQPESFIDYVSIDQGSEYGGALADFKGAIQYSGSNYEFPLTTETKTVTYDSKTQKPWPVVLSLTAFGAPANGIAINSGDLVATLNMHQTNDKGESHSYKWSIYANNNVVVPTGACDVSERNVTITLPDYPGTATVPLTVRCAQNQQLAYYLTGSTTDTSNTVFSNTSSLSPATGVGVQLSNQTDIIATNKKISLGTVGTSPVSLGLIASYARSSGQVVAGNVQSIIGVTFEYE